MNPLEMLVLKVCLYLFMCVVPCSCLVKNYTFHANMPCDEDIDISVDEKRATTAKSVIPCAVLCTEKTGCGGFLYYNGTNACHGVNAESPILEACALPGTMFYKATTDCATKELLAGLPGAQFTASSYWFSPEHAKMQMPNAWIPSDFDSNAYLQVDFMTLETIVSISTRGSDQLKMWMGPYKVLVSSDCAVFDELTGDDGKAKIFPGNTDMNTTVTNEVTPNVKARCVRINPVIVGKNTALKIEMMGLC